MRYLHLTIRGRVQGVGYRAWCAREAQERGLSGWVRNRASGAVEAVLAGPEAAVTAMADACRSGPPGARVDDLLVHEASEAALAAGGGAGRFVVLPTL
ncbi:acylphosphatase [Aquabacter sediminis]|uniref:acylphosphatase n=1 Tax=Aquabacter sediminis TaxID=3029197 RepID=UPI00237EB536|nr:acylphosphatase [Aquabacter sp. P-9]MDE1566554.1 acylphosphatase [Aquabacter sp. P-9]